VNGWHTLKSKEKLTIMIDVAIVCLVVIGWNVFLVVRMYKEKKQ